MALKIKKICVISANRSEYGLLYWLLKKIDEEKKFNLKLIVTGSHLSKFHGLTVREIISDALKIDTRIENDIKRDNSTSILQSIATGIAKITDYLKKTKPDIFIVCGDRYDIFPAVIAAFFLKIPIFHIHGGETTKGSIDEGIRHSITKMSWAHFVANEEYKKRVIQLGENPKRVFVVGGLGVDSIKKTKLLNKKLLEKKIGYNFGRRNIIVTFHPVTNEKESSKSHFTEILKALKFFQNINLIFTYPNSDEGNLIIKKMINNFVKKNKNSKIFNSLGRVNYLSVLSHVDCILGNSSSGILEAPTFNIATINIGDRQEGRIRARSVINCQPKSASIVKSINLVYKKKFREKIKKNFNPYGNGNASDKIVKLIKKIKIPNDLKKDFYNL